jgi:myo-inositol-1(or 4)-monophosphatase
MLEREQAVAVAAARAAGEVIRRYHATSVAVEVRAKGPDSPVTAADLEANRAIRLVISDAFPDHGWLSEETADSNRRLHERRVWIVDPLDGTKELVRRIPEFCVCVALVEDGDVCVGVTYDPIADRMYAARRGGGLTVNGEPARTSATTDLRDARILASRSEDERGEWEAYKPHARIVLCGSVALKLARVAAGEGDATFSLTPKNEWDICSGALLVREGGGQITDRYGRPLVFNRPDPLRPGLIAANGHLHGAVTDLIARIARSGS